VAKADEEIGEVGDGGVSPGLSTRLQDIPGVASVAVDLTESGGGINIRLEPDADEVEVMEKVRALLVAYGVRTSHAPKLRLGRQPRHVEGPLPVDIQITPIKGGARVEVASKVIRSFRIVAPTPMAIAQGVADAWCQVIGKIPIEVAKVEIEGDVWLTVVTTDGTKQSSGAADITAGWQEALGRAVGRALGVVDSEVGTEAMAVNS
jgi:hypothetical protein